MGLLSVLQFIVNQLFIVYLVLSGIYGALTKLTGTARIVRFILYSVLILGVLLAAEIILPALSFKAAFGYLDPTVIPTLKSNFVSYLLIPAYYFAIGIVFFYLGIFVRFLAKRK